MKPLRNPSNKKEREFQEICLEALASGGDAIIKMILAQKATGDNGALALQLEKKMLIGIPVGVEPFFVSEKSNEPIWRLIPSEVRQRILNNPTAGYIIFFGWSGLFCSFILTKDGQQVK